MHPCDLGRGDGYEVWWEGGGEGRLPNRTV